MKSNLPTDSAASSLQIPRGKPNLQRIVRLSARLLNVPIVFVSLVEERVAESPVPGTPQLQSRVASAHGIEAANIDTGAHVIDQALQNRTFFSTTRSNESRTGESPSGARAFWPVAEDLPFTWFASVPLLDQAGHSRGILALLDTEEKKFDPDDREVLRDLAALAVRETHPPTQESRDAGGEEAETSPSAGTNTVYQSATHLQLALQAGAMGTWEWNASDKNCTWSAELALLLGRSLQELPPGIENFLSCVHPDDRDLFRKRKEVAAWRKMNEVEYRIVRPDGEIRWLVSRGKPIRNTAGHITHVLGITSDVTRRHRAEEALRESQDRFKSAFEHSMVGLALIGTDGRWLDVNQALCDLLGYTADELRATNIQSLTHPADLPSGLVKIDRALRGEITSYELEKRYYHKDGHILWLQISGSLLRDRQSRPLYFISQFQDVTERKNTESAILAAKEEAESANLAKTEFISRMSHELRTPLNAILGFSQLLDMSDLAPRDHESLKQISQAGRHLLKLINEVLDIARIESGSLSVSLEPVHIAEIGIEVLDLVRPHAFHRGIKLDEAALRTCNCHVVADRQRFKQVLLNLLFNAINYNRPEGQVQLLCERGDTMLRLAVQDTGPGIEPHLIPRLFVPFDRLGAERTEVEGTGVGLALCKRLMEAMKGSIGVQSTPGTGSTFWVELPYANDPDRLAGDSSMAPDVTAPSSFQHSILYIEDNLSNLKLVQRIIERRQSFRLLSAMQGSLGIELARQHKPVLILLDLDLPEMDGEEVLRRLRRDATTRDIPVVIISADATPGRIDRLKDAGVKSYLTKPLDLHEFMGILDSIQNQKENGISK